MHDPLTPTWASNIASHCIFGRAHWHLNNMAVSEALRGHGVRPARSR